MRGRTHLGIGLLTGALPQVIGLSGPEGLLSWAALALGSLAPDLDGGGLVTKPSAWVPSIIPIPEAVSRAVRKFGRWVKRRGGHRGPLHYPLIAVILLLLAACFQLAWLAWLAVGYGSHLFADSLTKGGIPLFGPLSRKRYGLIPKALRIVNDGKVEQVILVIAWVGFLAITLLKGQ